MDHDAPIDEHTLIARQTGAPASVASADDLSWAVVKMRAGERIVVSKSLITAYQAASSPHSIRALKSDLEAFDLWCRRYNRIALPATPETVADYLDARAEKGSKPASLGRYKASIAKIHQLLDLKDPTPASLVKLRLMAIRRRLGTSQKQARPLRFKGPVRNLERDEPRGFNIRAMLESCPDDLPGLRDRALLSAGYDTGLRASELVAIDVEHIIEAIDPEARLLQILRSKGDQEGEGATAYLSPRTVRTIAAWLEAAAIEAGPVFRRVNVRRYKAKAAVRGRPIDSISGRETWDLRKTLSKPAVTARVEYDVGEGEPGDHGEIIGDRRPFRRAHQLSLTRRHLPRRRSPRRSDSRMTLCIRGASVICVSTAKEVRRSCPRDARRNH